MEAVVCAFEGTMQVGECPLWQPDEQALYWVDINGFAVHRLHPATGQHKRWQMPSEPSAIARCATGGLIVAMRTGFFHLDSIGARKLQLDLALEHAAPLVGPLLQIEQAPYDTATTRFNDGRVDCAGRFWVGTIYEPRDKPAAEMFYLERGRVHRAWSGGMTNSNGLAFSPDQRRMYHADTSSHTVRVMDFEPATATVGALSVFKQFSSDKANNYGGRPDGAAVDVEGAYWCAMFEGGRVLRFAPDGTLLQEIALPVRCPTMVAFGGEDLRTLYITSARHGRSEAELADYPLSGAVLSVRVDVPGRVEHAYLP
ncbi:MAG TPA: SMP-30/gluconolactonase/LRE family protein [Burkholderiaceae bacterium]